MKAVISGLGYRDYVMDLDDAVAFIKALEGAEQYRTKYHHAVEATPTTEGRKAYTTKHVWRGELENISLRLLSADDYRAGKLLGEPNE